MAALSTTLTVLLGLLPAGLWCAWFLWCVNWPKVWPSLARGGWAVVVLLGLVVALAWSVIFPRPLLGLGNFTWQLGAVTLLIAAALFCGWLQGKLGWTPAEVSFAPPADSHGHGHGGHH
jgi:hypothetical protein